jgi:hypothetical protein
MIWSENRSLWNPHRQKPDQREKHKGCQSLPAGYCSAFGAPELGLTEPLIVRRKQGPMSNSRPTGDFLTGDKPREIG